MDFSVPLVAERCPHGFCSAAPPTAELVTTSPLEEARVVCATLADALVTGGGFFCTAGWANGTGLCGCGWWYCW